MASKKLPKGELTPNLKKIDRALKVINQRIAEAGKENQFGRDSNVYKQMVAPLESVDLERYVGKSASGDFKVKRSEVIKALSDGKNHPELERILNVAGYTFGKRKGFFRETKEGKQIKTITEIKKEWKRLIDPNGNMSNKELKENINEGVTLSDDFKSLIYEYKDTFGYTDEKLREDFPDLFGKGTRGELDDETYYRIRGEMTRKLIKEKKEDRKAISKAITAFGNK